MRKCVNMFAYLKSSMIVLLPMVLRIFAIGLFIVSLGCSYGFVTRQDRLPGGIRKVSIPTFSNRTHESGLENIFTTELRNEFFKSRIVTIVSTEQAEGEIIGVIGGVSTEPLAHSEEDLKGRSSKILANEYRAKMDVSISLVRLPSKEVVWERSFSDSRQYVTTNDLLKNEVKQQEAFKKIASYLMEQAHDAMLEDF